MQMKRFALPVLLMFGAAGLFAQDLADLNYVVNQQGDTLRGEAIVYRKPILRTAFFDMGETKVDWNEVGMIRNRHGVFVNVSALNDGKETYAMRIKKGSISVLERVDMNVYGGEHLPFRISEKKEKSILATGRMDYLMDEEGNLYGTSFRELREAFTYSAAAQQHLKRMNRYRWLRGLLAGAGGVLTGVGVMQAANGGGATPALVLGLVGAGSNFFFVPAIDDARWQALEAYNAE